MSGRFSVSLKGKGWLNEVYLNKNLSFQARDALTSYDLRAVKTAVDSSRLE